MTPTTKPLEAPCSIIIEINPEAIDSTALSQAFGQQVLASDIAKFIAARLNKGLCRISPGEDVNEIHVTSMINPDEFIARLKAPFPKTLNESLGSDVKL